MDSPHIDKQTLLQWIFGFQISQAIFVVVKLEIADQLEVRPLSCEELAKATGAHPKALYRLMRALASQGIFKETNPTYFEHTPLSQLLTTQHESSLKLTALMYGEEQYRAWGDLYYSITMGKDSFSHIYNEDFFSYLEGHPKTQNIFNEYLNKNSSLRMQAILESYDFSNNKKIIDIGGGHGKLLIKLLHRYPNTQGIVFDTKKVIDSVPSIQESSSYTKRIEFISGNFFESVPAGGDIYFLSHIIHDWEDKDAIKILQNCRRAMVDGGKIILVEYVIKSGNLNDFAKWMDLHMLVTLNGKERTHEEFSELLHAAGFQLTNAIATHVGSSILEGSVAKI